MASTGFLLQLCISAVILTDWFGVTADFTTSLECPAVFKAHSINTITYKINSTGISNAGCLSATSVVFEFKPKAGQTATTSPCSHRYPPITCSDFTTNNTCGCTKQDGGEYTYKYTFPVEDIHEGGSITATLCVQPSEQIKEPASPSCNSISFCTGFKRDCPWIVLVLVLFFVVVFLDGGIIWTVCKKEVCLQIVALVLLVVVWVLIVVDLVHSCKDLSADDECLLDDQCKHLCVGLGITFIFLQNEIAMIALLCFAFLQKRPLDGTCHVVLFLVFLAMFLPIVGTVVFIVYIICQRKGSTDGPSNIVLVLAFVALFVPYIMIIVILVYIYHKKDPSDDTSLFVLALAFVGIFVPIIGIVVFFVYIRHQKGLSDDSPFAALVCVLIGIISPVNGIPILLVCIILQKIAA